MRGYFHLVAWFPFLDVFHNIMLGYAHKVNLSSQLQDPDVVPLSFSVANHGGRVFLPCFPSIIFISSSRC